jgi:DNA repair photolyase
LKKYNPNSDETQIYTELPPTEVSANSFKAIFTGAKKTEFAAYVQDRIAFQWGGLSDPFDMFEKRRGLGLELLQFLHQYKYPVCFSTKGMWWLDDSRYTDLFRGNDFWNVKVSIINLDADKAKLMERGCPTPQARLAGIRKLVNIQDNGKSKSGAGVTLRLRPFIIGYSDTNDEYLELIHQAAKAGATAVSTEFFCMEGRMTPESAERFNAMSEICGMDLIEFYKRNSPHAAGYMRLNHQVKRPYIDKMEAACKKEGMRFYVSDAHHKDRCNNGSCCGLSEKWNYARGQFTEALLVAKKNGFVTWEDIAVKMPDCWKTINIVKANGLNLARGNARDRARFRDFSVYDYMRYIWNSPNHPRSPYKYFYGALFPIRVDEFSKNVVYQFKTL